MRKTHNFCLILKVYEKKNRTILKHTARNSRLKTLKNRKVDYYCNVSNDIHPPITDSNLLYNTVLSIQYLLLVLWSVIIKHVRSKPIEGTTIQTCRTKPPYFR